MKLEDISQIVDGLCVFMPNGVEAEIFMNADNSITVKYKDAKEETYTQDEFGNIINDGVEIFDPVTIPQQSVLMEDEVLDKEFDELNDVEELIAFIDKHPEYKLWQEEIDESQLQDINKLDKIQKTAADVKTKQSAITLMNAVGMGVKLDKEIDKLEKKNKVDEAQYTDDEYYDDIMQGRAGYNPESAVITEGKWQVFPITDAEPESYYAVTWIGEGSNEDLAPLQISRFYNSDITNWTIMLDDKVVKRFQWGTQLSVIADWVNNTYKLEDPLTVYILNVIVDMDKEGRLTEADEEISTFQQGTEEYKRLEDAADELSNLLDLTIKVEDTYFDAGQDWSWTTLIAYDDKGKYYNKGSHWQLIYPPQQRELLYGDYDNGIKMIYNMYIKKQKSINEISDKLADDVKQKRITNFVNAKLRGEDARKAATKLNKNLKLNAKRNKENEMEDISKLTEQLNVLLNEISDKTVQNAYEKRANNLSNALDNSKEKLDSLSQKTAELNGEIDKALENDWKDSKDELDKADKKYRNNVELAIKRALRKSKDTKKNEEFTDEMSMLTDINDLDFPDALADTVETTDDGEVLTLGKVADEIKDMKDEIVTELQDVKSEIKAELQSQEQQDIENDIEDTIEFEDNLEDLEDKVDDLEDEIKDETDETQLDSEDSADEVVDDNENNDDNEDNDNNEANDDNEEPELKESFKKYIRTGKLENLQQQKMNIDKAVRTGEDVETIKNDIVLNSENEKEEKEAKEYASAKLKESLLNSKYTSVLKDIVRD